MTRTDAILALLASLFDYLPSPKTARYADQPGPAPSERKPCPKCSGAGHYGKRKRRCAACDGTGVVAVDEYTGEQVAMADQRAPASDARRIEAELRRLAKDEAIRRGRMLDDPFAWEAERIRYRRAGDYAALERALEGLRANLPVHYSAVMRVVYGQPENGAAPLIGEGVEWLSARMPPTIRVPSWVSSPRQDQPGKGRWANGFTKAQRDERIRQLAAEGRSQVSIAAEFGLSQSAVSRIVAQPSEAA